MNKFNIGEKWIQRGKNRADQCEIIDILKTYNSKGELVKLQYLSGHEFMGQVVKHLDCETTIARAKWKEDKNE